MEKLSPTTRKNPLNDGEVQRDFSVKINSANKDNKTH